MRVSPPPPKGKFEVFNSFAILRRAEFYLIGQLLEGEVEAGWFLSIPLNSELHLTVRITAVEDVHVTDESLPYKLLDSACEPDSLDVMLALRIERETLDICIEGCD